MVYEKLGFRVSRNAILDNGEKGEPFSFVWGENGFCVYNKENEPVLDASLLFKDGVITISTDRLHYKGVIFKPISRYEHAWKDDMNFQLIE